MISFRVLGTPKAQPRPRAALRKVFGPSGPQFIARAYDSGSAEGWKSEIARAAEDVKPSAPFVGAVRLEVVLLFPRPKTLMRKRDPQGRLRHAAKPDRDNCEKAVLDILQGLGFLANDSQVCAGEVSKFYCAVGELPGAEIRIGPCEEIAGTNEELVMGLFKAPQRAAQHEGA
jgi:Holliday junction resolvase RusA-like endonuclease